MMVIPAMEGFQYRSFPQQVIFQPGALDRLGQAVEQQGWERLMLCTGPALRKAGHAGQVEKVLGNRLVAIFDRVQPHVQDVQVEAAQTLAEKKSVQAVIGLGGGSPIGMAKAVAHSLSEKRAGGSPRASTADQACSAVIAIPTTYAGSEMTPVYGITHSRERPPRKVTVNDPHGVPQLVLYDPRLTLDLSPELTASTGLNALAHCVEALYSVTRHPFSTAAAAGGARWIAGALLRCFQNGQDLTARTEMLTGAHLAGLSLASVSMGLHHGLCHVLGGSANVPHGIANAILLPYAIRFNADHTAPLLLPLVEALGLPVAGRDPVAAVEEAAQAIYDLVGGMKLPQHLRQVGIKEGDLPRLAALAFQNRTVQNNPKPIQAAAQLEGLLKEAW